MSRLVLIAFGGAIGTALRYLTSLVAVEWLGDQFPYGTLIVNLFGAFAIGLVQEVGTRTLLIPDDMRLFITTGIMGGLTTYSTFSIETIRLMEIGEWSRAGIYVAVTTGACLLLCFLGIALARFILSPRG